MGIPANISSRRFFAAAMLLTLAAQPAVSATFRQLPVLPTVPPSIEHPAEREILERDVSRLAQRRDNIEALRQKFAEHCSQPRLGGSLSRQCQFRQVEIRRESSKLRTDTLSLRERMRRIEAGILRERPHGSGRQSRLKKSDGDGRRLEIVREALKSGEDDWAPVLKDLRKRLALGAGDPAVRDAAAYLIAVHEGRIAAENLDHPYYKHGVRRWLAGDFWSAAVAFSRAARDNPGDRLVYASYASAAGRQHATPACALTGRCVRGDLVVWASRFGSGSGSVMRMLLKEEAKASSSSRLRSLLNKMRAISIYETEPQTGPAGGTAPGAGLKGAQQPQSGDYATIAQGFLNVWEISAADRARVFSSHYRGGMKGTRDSEVYARASSREYLAKLRRGLLSDDSTNPFAGALTRAQIIRLQR